ncbi:MAG: CehA/McbA family metallohydrolase [Limisphaerales bacterium]
MLRSLLIPVLLVLFAALLPLRAQVRVLDAAQYHLGTEGFPEWQEFVGKKPHGRMLEVRFEAQANATEQTLLLRQRDVKQGWQVQLNGRRLGSLVTQETSLVHALAVPPGALRDGTNTLAILPPTAVDDIVVEDFRLVSSPLKATLAQATLAVRVTDSGAKSPLPCRLTIVDASGALAALQAGTTNQSELAARPGVIYTREGSASAGLLPGKYTIFASRGFECSVATQAVTLVAGQTLSVALTIRRAVPTHGWISADTHIHTLTKSKHGDATEDERMLTIAGEGIELAVATDHNVHADYAEAAQRTGMNTRFTAVIGNEVTTKAGHFNAFPILPGSTVADFSATNWNELLPGIRATPGVQVITLNHPRDLHSGFVPLGPANFNPVSGAALRGQTFSFDGLEVITSAAMQSDIMLLFRDWFALLNHGHRITALGSSDTHDVSRFILGQGRTYVKCADTNPAAINVDEACRNLRAGRALVSFGLLTDLVVNDRFGVGDLATRGQRGGTAVVTVLGPEWVPADKVELFADGLVIAEQKLAPARGVTKARVAFKLPRFKHDVHLVAIASGPGVTAPFWETPRPYQPSSKVFTPRVLGATNPVWLDADGDGKFTAARGYAEQLVQRHGMDAGKLFPALAHYDEAVAAQAASLCHAAGKDLRGVEYQRALRDAARAVQHGWVNYAGTIR